MEMEKSGTLTKENDLERGKCELVFRTANEHLLVKFTILDTAQISCDSLQT